MAGCTSKNLDGVGPGGVGGSVVEYLLCYIFWRVTYSGLPSSAHVREKRILLRNKTQQRNESLGFPILCYKHLLNILRVILLWPSVSRNLLKYLLPWGAGERYLMFCLVWLFIWWHWLAKHHLTRSKIESPNSFGLLQETLLFYTFSFHFSNQYYFNFNKRTQSKERKTKSLNVLCFLNKQKTSSNLFTQMHTHIHTHNHISLNPKQITRNKNLRRKWKRTSHGLSCFENTPVKYILHVIWSVSQGTYIWWNFSKYLLGE